MKNNRIVTSFDKVNLPMDREDALLARILLEADAERAVLGKEKKMNAKQTSVPKREASVHKAAGHKKQWPLILVACFLLAVTLVACIPEARAEVLSWFGWSTNPADYMSKDPDAREDAAQVDALISSVSGNEDPVVTNEGGADRVSKLLKERLDVSLSETMYDGDSIYVTMRLGKGFGVWLIENYTGGTVASVAIPPEKLGDFFSPTVPESYLSGEDIYYSHTTGQLVMTLPDDTIIGGAVSIADDEAFSTLLQETQMNPQDVDALVEQFVSTNDVMAYAALKIDPTRIAAMVDENGNVTGKLSLLLQIELDGSMTTAPTTVLEADVCDMTVNVTTYRDFITGATGSTEEVAWSGETILTHFDDSDMDESTYGNNVYTNHVLSLDGLKMKALSADVDATGIRKLQIEITYPESWSDEVCRQFHHKYGIRFKLLINGEEGEWQVSGVPRYETRNPHKSIWYCRQVQFVPLGLLPEITELTLIPYIGYCTAYTDVKFGADGEEVSRGERVQLVLNEPLLLPNDYSGEFDMETTYFPQYAMSLFVTQD